MWTIAMCRMGCSLASTCTRNSSFYRVLGRKVMNTRTSKLTSKFWILLSIRVDMEMAATNQESPKIFQSPSRCFFPMDRLLPFSKWSPWEDVSFWERKVRSETWKHSLIHWHFVPAGLELTPCFFGVAVGLFPILLLDEEFLNLHILNLSCSEW